MKQKSCSILLLHMTAVLLVIAIPYDHTTTAFASIKAPDVSITICRPGAEPYICDEAQNLSIYQFLYGSVPDISACRESDTILDEPPISLCDFIPSSLIEELSTEGGMTFGVLFLIDENGDVIDCTIKGPNRSREKLEELANVIVYWTWKPAIVNGEPRPVWVHRTLEFKSEVLDE